MYGELITKIMKPLPTDLPVLEQADLPVLEQAKFDATDRRSLPNEPIGSLVHQAVAILERAWQEFDQPHRKFLPQPSLYQPSFDNLPAFPTSARQVFADVEDHLNTSLAQPRRTFFAYVGSSGLEVAVLAEVLASAFDINLATSAGTADKIEAQTLDFVGEFVGYRHGGGMTTSGGMVSNLTALCAAREKAMKKSRSTGVSNRQGAFYCSVEAHHSVQRSAEILGIGSNFVRKLPIDAQHCLIPEAVNEAIENDKQNGIIPIAIIATAGTTLTGAIDPIAELSTIAKHHQVWLHVDGAYGLAAAAILKDNFIGINEADSVSIDAHKWLFVPKSCGILLVKDKAWLAQTFSHDADYMLHADQLNPVDLTLEYSRPLRALKLWVAFKTYGRILYENAIKQNLAQARLCADLVKTHRSLELFIYPQLSVVPFRHVPEWLRGDEEAINTHNKNLVEIIKNDGMFVVSSAVIDKKVCLRPCFTNFRTTEEDIRNFIDAVVKFGNER